MGEVSNSARMYPVFAEFGERYQAGDMAGIEAILRRADAGEFPLTRANLVHALGLADRVRAGERGPVNAGFGEPGGRLCDYCLSAEVEWYFPFTPFTMVDRLDYRSGDRMYACGRCHDLADAGRWGALADWVGPAARDVGVRALWSGVRMNRTGPAVRYDPADDR